MVEVTPDMLNLSMLWLDTLLDLRHDDDPEYTVYGREYHPDGSTVPLLAYSWKQMMEEMDPFHALPCGPQIVAGFGVHAAESLPDGW